MTVKTRIARFTKWELGVRERAESGRDYVHRIADGTAALRAELDKSATHTGPPRPLGVLAAELAGAPPLLPRSPRTRRIIEALRAVREMDDSPLAASGRHAPSASPLAALQALAKHGDGLTVRALVDRLPGTTLCRPGPTPDTRGVGVRLAGARRRGGYRRARARLPAARRDRAACAGDRADPRAPDERA
jgi:hypothetical protein